MNTREYYYYYECLNCEGLGLSFSHHNCECECADLDVLPPASYLVTDKVRVTFWKARCLKNVHDAGL